MSTVTVSEGSVRVRKLTEGALCVALSVVLSYLKLFRMPQGGSITLEMAPILFFAYRCGAKWAVGAGALSGLLQMLFGGSIYHPVQAILDYPVAFACVGLAGAFGERLISGALAGGAARLACHVVSGAVFFAAYAPAGQNPWIYSAVYNLTFMIPALILSGGAAWILWKKLGDITPPR